MEAVNIGVFPRLRRVNWRRCIVPISVFLDMKLFPFLNFEILHVIF